MKTRELVVAVVGLFFTCQSNTPAMADDADTESGFAASAIGAHELHQIRGGLSVARDFQNIVVLAGVPPQARRGINKPDLIEGLAGVPAAVSGISEALVTTWNGVRESIGQIAALPRETAVGFGDGIRGRRPSVPNPDILNPDFLNPN